MLGLDSLLMVLLLLCKSCLGISVLGAVVLEIRVPATMVGFNSKFAKII